MRKAHGGTRPGAGRKPSPIGSTVRRVPDPIIPALDALVEQFRQAQELPAAALRPAPAPARLELPLYGETVPMGFPSPAQGYIEKHLDLNEHLVSNPLATFFLAAKGDSLVDLGIFDGDIFVVDRSIEPRHKNLVIAAVDGEFTAKTLYRRGGVCELRPANAANPDYRPIPFPQTEDDRIVGVIVWVIKKCTP